MSSMDNDSKANDWEYDPNNTHGIYLQTPKKNKFIGCDTDGSIKVVHTKDNPMTPFESIPRGDGYVALKSRANGYYLSVGAKERVVGIKEPFYFLVKAEAGDKFSFKSEKGKQFLYFDAKKMMMKAKSKKGAAEIKFFIWNASTDTTTDAWNNTILDENDLLSFNTNDNIVTVSNTDKKAEVWVNAFGKQIVGKGYVKRWQIKVIPKFDPAERRSRYTKVKDATKESMGADGVVTKAVEAVPVVGYVAAAGHLAAGDKDRAKRAAAKCTSSTVVAGAVAGTVALTVATGGTAAVVGAAGGAISAGAGMATAGAAAAGVTLSATAATAGATAVVTGATLATAGAAAGATGGAVGVFAESQIGKTIDNDDIKSELAQGTKEDYIKAMKKGAIKGAISGATAGLADGMDAMAEAGGQTIDNAAELAGGAIDQMEMAGDITGDTADLMEKAAEHATDYAKDKLEDMVKQDDDGLITSFAKDQLKETQGIAEKQVKASIVAGMMDDDEKKTMGDKMIEDRRKECIADMVVGIASCKRLEAENGGFWLKPTCGYAYYGYNGKKFNVKRRGANYGAKFYIEDKIVVELNMDKCEVGFYVNDVYQGKAFDIDGKEEYCLAVSLKNTDYDVKIV